MGGKCTKALFLTNVFYSRSEYFKHFPCSNVPGTLTDARDTAKQRRPGTDPVTLQVAGERDNN